MTRKILYTAATQAEADVLLKVKGITREGHCFKWGDLQIFALVTGVGYTPTAWRMMDWIHSNFRPDFAVNSGIAGSFNEKIVKGEVVMPVTECFADSGIEDAHGMKTLFEAGLANPDEFPFDSGCIRLPEEMSVRFCSVLKPVNAVTLGMASGSESTISRIVEKFHPDIETMEGAVFFYICNMESIPFLAVRAISNPVEVRNREHWDVPLALGNLSVRLNEIFNILNG